MNDVVEQSMNGNSERVKKHIVILAGEASGDFLGANLIEALKKNAVKQGVDLTLSGIGGPRMTEQGLLSLFPMYDLSVMGVSEVLSSLPRILKRLRQTKKYLAACRPDMLLTIDSPDFCLRVAKSAKKNNPNLKTVHYVSPTVWAWREGRAKTISRFLDIVLCLFPFETPYYERLSITPKFVGHPLAQKVPVFSNEAREEFYARMKLNPENPVLCVLPGSRRGEIRSLASVFAETVRRLKEEVPNLQVTVPTLQPFAEDLTNAFDGLGVKIVVPLDDKDKFLTFSCATAALHASGTVGLELALCDTPMVTAYRVSQLTGFVGRMLIKTKFVNLVNILLEREAVKERLQKQCEPALLVDDLIPLLTDKAAADAQRADLRLIRPALLPSDKKQSSADCAAEAVMELLN